MARAPGILKREESTSGIQEPTFWDEATVTTAGSNLGSLQANNCGRKDKGFPKMFTSVHLEPVTI